jgi:omega-6 fatty acid desaturase (delta-12 desaturase)
VAVVATATRGPAQQSDRDGAAIPIRCTPLRDPSPGCGRVNSKSSTQSRPAGAHSSGFAPPEGKRWTKLLAGYGVPDPKRGVLELLFTGVPLLLLWAIMLHCLERYGYWACLLLAPLAAAFLVRLFMIQHDCGHGSFFRRRTSNDRIGRIIGVLTLTPYGYWRRTHAVHHATTGNLDRRGMGDVPLLTVAEYRALSLRRRIAYRLSRNPLVLLGLGPLFLFVLKYRLPVGLIRDGKGVWISAMSTNLAIAGVVIGMCALVGIKDFMLVQIPITLLAGSVGVWLFYVQHQFEDTYWARGDAWSFHAGALRGATHYELPAVLRWFTANIGIHHIHHLASRIPSYRLREALADHPELRDVGRLTLLQSLRCFHLALWDEETGKLVAFRDLATPPGSC